jgi:uncharacterized phage-like protein YoqJ
MNILKVFLKAAIEEKIEESKEFILREGSVFGSKTRKCSVVKPCRDVHEGPKERGKVGRKGET